MSYTSREPRLKNLYDAAEASTPASWARVVPQFAAGSNGLLDFSRPLVKPESLFDLELGAGYATDAVGATVTSYWMEFYNEIVNSGQVDRFGQPITGNAERTRHTGIEFSGRALLAEGLTLEGNASFSRNRFVRHIDYSRGSSIALDGNPITGFPDLLGNLRLTYRGDEFALSLSGRYVGKQYTDNFRNDVNSADPFWVGDAWCSYTIRDLPGGTSLEAKVQVNNVFNRLYAAYGEGGQFFVGAERNAFFNLALTL
jgi:iron complex outermembrane receptor protein